MHERYDFSWEREWRIRKDLEFATSDIVCAILPTDGEDQYRRKFAKMGIAVISPGWTYEQIVTELALQQRDTKALAGSLEGKTSAPEKRERAPSNDAR
jgi:hypothetical protein